jgi:Ras family protein T1
VYDVARPDTFARIESHWLPRVRALTAKAAHETPVILVGNKTDLRAEPLTDAELEHQFAPVTARYREVECCVECSAKLLTNVKEIFYFAQKSVLYPTAVLIDVAEDSRPLRPACIAALNRIFQLCDADCDGLLSDAELNAFQQRVFKATLQPHEIEGVKREVLKCDAASVRESALTVTGFVFLHQLFIQKGRLETVWAVLRKFGYADDLQLEPSYVAPDVDADDADPCQLSPDGVQFFNGVFDRYAAGGSRLTLLGMQRLFGPSPCAPWGVAFERRVALRGLSRDEYEAQWRATTLFDWRTTLLYAAYLGAEGDTRRFLHFGAHGPPGSHDAAKSDDAAENSDDEDDDDEDDDDDDARKKRPAAAAAAAAAVDKRTVFACYVVGPENSGKSTLLHGDIGGGEQGEFANGVPRAVMVPINGVRYVLAMHEVLADSLPAAPSLALADLVCIVYDSSDGASFAAAAELHRRTEALLDAADLQMPPCCVLAAKSDKEAAVQKSPVTPFAFCEANGYPPPVSVALTGDDHAPAAAHELLVKTILSWKPPKPRRRGVIRTILGLGLLAALIGGAAWYVVKKTNLVTGGAGGGGSSSK